MTPEPARTALRGGRADAGAEAKGTPGRADATNPLTVLLLDTERGWRGGERQVLWHAEALTRLGHRALIAARAGEPLAARAAAAGIRVIACRPLAEFDPFAARVLRGTIRRERVDIVHAHTAHAVSLGALACRGTTAKLVVTRHSDFRLKTNLASRWKYAQVDALIAISSAAANAMAASGIAAERVTVVRGGTDQSRRIAPASPDVLASLGVPAGAPLVVQVSALVPHKDPITFVRAIAAARRRVPGLHALLVGEGPLRRAVEAAVAGAGVGEFLHLAGYRTDADALLAAADVVTLSSEQDALPSVLFDALFCAKPICATAAGGIPEIVEAGVSGLLAPVADGDALGDAIARVLSEPALAVRLAAGAAARSAEFSMETSVRRTLAVYDRVLGRPRG